MSENRISAGTIARTVVLIVSLVNTILTAVGKNPLPYADTDVYNGVSALITVVVSLVAWWKNNSFTKEAIEADKTLKALKKGGGV